MFQSFDDPPAGQIQRSHLRNLRERLSTLALDGFIIPKADEFQNEYVPPHADRLNWLTGFSGSAGTAIVLRDAAALIVDSRYTLQAKQQVNAEDFSVENFPEVTPESYLRTHTFAGSKIGYDPRLHSVEVARKLEKSAAGAGFELAALAESPIDALWTGRPEPRNDPAYLHDVRYAGEDAISKLARMQAKIKEKKADALFLASPESVAWLFNLRGSDIEHTPLVMARAYLPVEGKAQLFIDPRKLSEDLREVLQPVSQLLPLAEADQHLPSLVQSGATIWIDPARVPEHFRAVLNAAGAHFIEAVDPCIHAKAIKNETELHGAHVAHLRDGVALCRFLAWLDHSTATGEVDEISATQKLETFRRETNALRDISFDTISGAGDHGAIVHYRVTQATNRPLIRNSLYLIDSGAQYLDGTTDVTRTVAIGAPTPEMQRHFTLVLKAHIALATARFPKGTRGVDLDGIARDPLWRAGLDYGHGTGHGIGSYLSVHEGPQSISRNGMAALEPGMILSIEPGYYLEGRYGIRIENLVFVTPPQDIEGGALPMMAFEALTLAPIDRRLVDPDLLLPDEREWLNRYHARVLSEIGPQLAPDERDWLAMATAPI